MESDPDIPADKKLEILKEWFTKDFNKMASVGYSTEDFQQMCVDSKVLFRHRVKDLLKFTDVNHVPLYIISAGIKEVLDESLKLLDGDF